MCKKNGLRCCDKLPGNNVDLQPARNDVKIGFSRAYGNRLHERFARAYGNRLHEGFARAYGNRLHERFDCLESYIIN